MIHDTWYSIDTRYMIHVYMMITNENMIPGEILQPTVWVDVVSCQFFPSILDNLDLTIRQGVTQLSFNHVRPRGRCASSHHTIIRYSSWILPIRGKRMSFMHDAAAMLTVAVARCMCDASAVFARRWERHMYYNYSADERLIDRANSWHRQHI